MAPLPRRIKATVQSDFDKLATAVMILIVDYCVELMTSPECNPGFDPRQLE